MLDFATLVGGDNHFLKCFYGLYDAMSILKQYSGRKTDVILAGLRTNKGKGGLDVEDATQ